MTRMPASFRQRRRGTGFRFASLLAFVAQLMVALLAPAADARAERGAQSHIEVPDSHRHIVHVDALCSLCAAQHLLAHPEAALSLLADESPSEPAQSPELVRHTLLLRGGFAPRAPPQNDATG